MTQPTTPETPADAGTPTPFEVGLQLRWSDEDRYGHVNNARLLTLAEYKRRQSAPGVKVTRRNFGRDRRYPIVNRFRDSGRPPSEPHPDLLRASGRPVAALDV